MNATATGSLWTCWRRVRQGPYFARGEWQPVHEADSPLAGIRWLLRHAQADVYESCCLERGAHPDGSMRASHREPHGCGSKSETVRRVLEVMKSGEWFAIDQVVRQLNLACDHRHRERIRLAVRGMEQRAVLVRRRGVREGCRGSPPVEYRLVESGVLT